MQVGMASPRKWTLLSGGADVCVFLGSGMDSHADHLDYAPIVSKQDLRLRPIMFF